MNEIWKSIPNYERYFVSNFGNVKGLRGLLNPSKNHHGYLVVSLHNEFGKKQFKIHQLVALCFLNYKFKNHSLIIDHVNNDKSDNRLENLNLISQRANKSKDSNKTTSSYTGVYFQKKTGKYISMLYANNKYNYLGIFENEKEASEYYFKALLEYNTTGKVTTFKKYNKLYSSIKGITYNKRSKKYVLVINKKHIGYFKTEKEAIHKLKTLKRI